MGSMVNKIKAPAATWCSRTWSAIRRRFYREYKNQGLTHDKLPICATVTSEIEIAAMGAEYAVGSYTSFPYFQAIDTDRTRPSSSATRVRERSEGGDPSRVGIVLLPGLPVEAGGGKAAEITPVAIREAVKGQEFDAPNGHVKIEPENLHTYLTRASRSGSPTGRARSSTPTRNRSFLFPMSPMAKRRPTCSAPARGLRLLS